MNKKEKTNDSKFPLLILEWPNEIKREAFIEWVDFMSFYFIKIDEKLKYNLVSKRSKKNHN